MAFKYAVNLREQSHLNAAWSYLRKTGESSLIAFPKATSTQTSQTTSLMHIVNHHIVEMHDFIPPSAPSPF
jgi:hypothetical protein